MKKIELLAPAGDFDCLKAAISNGADAVYLGGKNFSARAFAQNFDHEELIRAIEYAHLRNVRIFVTLNTLLNEYEIENALKMADFYYQAHVNALLIQDLGLYYVLKERYPDFELHCSTQMHVHNLQGVINARKLGFKRVVLARESDLNLIKECCRQGIEIEVFVHGAICVSYSGQCLMSAHTKGRSANKGACAQCCRLKYHLYDENDHRIALNTEYPLSTKDMMLLDDIPDLIKAGVSSLKIEGRMKSSAYVGYVTSLYRKAIDSYYAGKKYQISDQERKDLKVLFNRNFTDDLLKGKNDLFGQKTPNHLGIRIGEVVNNRNGYTYIHLDDDLSQFDGIRIGDFGCIVNMLYKNELLVKEGKKGEIVVIRTETPLKGEVYKTYDHLLEERINQRTEKKVPLDLDVTILPDCTVSVKLFCLNEQYTYVSDKIAQKALKTPLNEENIRKQFSRLNETPYSLNKIDIHTENAFLPVSDLNEIRRQSILAFDAYRLSKFHKDPIDRNVSFIVPDGENKGPDMYQKGEEVILDRTPYVLEPVVNPQSDYSNEDHQVISEIGGLLLPSQHKIAYYSLNCSNSFCYEFLKKLGFEQIILSTELNDEQIIKLIGQYEERNHTKIYPYVFKQGKLPLMHIHADPFKDRLQNNRNYHLSDGQNTYEIHYNQGILELKKEVALSHESLKEKCSFFVSD
ncbi:MAG: U32 family peptidase [Erysipelotrichaceae bacterium]|nr:U32 family peptidase [Erysipelotrichaceae bacterium]